jgi:predicted Zn-dependent protease
LKWAAPYRLQPYSQTDRIARAIILVNAAPELLTEAIAARSQLTDRDNFHGKIAVNPEAAKAMSSAAFFSVAVHRIGHLLGLNHNASSQSIMYFLNVNGTEVLYSKDLLDLSTRHKLGTGAITTGFLPIDPSGSLSFGGRIRGFASLSLARS